MSVLLFSNLQNTSCMLKGYYVKSLETSCIPSRTDRTQGTGQHFHVQPAWQ